MIKPKKQYGFSLMELMIAMVIIGILAAVGIPTYHRYTQRAEFSELIHATAPYKLGVSECYMLTQTLSDCNAGEEQVPEAIENGKGLTQSVTVAQGVVVATPKDLHGFSSEDTYVLTPDVENHHLTWQSSGGAVSKGLAK